MIKSRLLKVLYNVAVITVLLFSLLFLVYGLIKYDWHDFDVFYTAAKAALSGESIYVTVGQYNLPFWYFPWTAWFYIPFALWPYKLGLILYQSATILCAIFVVLHLARNTPARPGGADLLFIYSMLVPMSVQLMQVGQMDYILLGLIVVIMFAVKQKKEVLTGLLLPFLWIKPHLVIIFTLAVFWRAGKRTLLISLGLSALMLFLETMLNPGWYWDMLRLLQVGSQRTGGLRFTTLPNMIGFQENWVGTANLPFTLVLLALALLAVWKFRSLPTIPMLSLALTASLFAAPRAYGYDLPLLIPAMIWLTTPDFKRNFWIWILAAFLPLLSQFNSITYLVTLLVFLLSLWKAYVETHPQKQKLSA